MSLRRWLGLAAALAGPLLTFATWCSVSPTPFSFKGDMWLLGTPISHLIGEAWASGHVPRLFWILGDGYNPWLAGQSGVAYPIVTLAYGVGQLFRAPERIQDWIVMLNLLVMAPWIWTHPMLRKVSATRRWLVMMMPVAHPAALILGQNWIYMHSTATWATLVMLELSAWLRWPSMQRFAWRSLAAVFMLFSAIHIQLFGFFLLFATLFVGVHPHARMWWRHARRHVCLAAGLLLPSYLAIWLASKGANPAWAPMGGWQLPLVHAQTIGTVLKGAILGNLWGSEPAFTIWRGVSPLGQGMFFLGPAVILALVWRPSRLRICAGAPLFALVVLMGIASLPWLAHAFIGPFGSFRWTWKFAIFLPAFSLVALLDLPKSRAAAWNALLGLNLAMAFAIGIKGLDVDFLPSLSAVHHLGVEALANPAREVKSRLHLTAEERILPVGRMEAMDEPVNPSWLGLNGNGPAVVGIGSLALYDNLEPAQSAAFRGEFSVPWRTALPENIEVQAWRRLFPLLASRGVRWLIFKIPPGAQTGLEARRLDLASGGSLWAVEVPGWHPRLTSRATNDSTSPPGASGLWHVPEGEWTLATARDISFDGTTTPDGRLLGPGTISYDPLKGYGALIALWCASILGWFFWGHLRQRATRPS